MGYIERNLIPGEQVLYETRLHWVVLSGTILLSLLLAAGGVALLYLGSQTTASISVRQRGTDWHGVGIWSGVFLLVFAVALLVTGHFRRNATEMAVTNKRVVIKTGIFSRKTFELLLSKVESIIVQEPPMGRILGYGTVIVRGIGGTPEPFAMVGNPLEFRKRVQQQIEAGPSM